MNNAEIKKAKILDALTESLNKQVDMYFSNPEMIQEYLNFHTRFHQYSFNNRILIHLANPDAQFVAGYNKWQELGFQVERGQKAINILMPNIVKTFSRGKDIVAVSRATAEEKIAIETGEILTKDRLVGYRVGKVFADNQTNMTLEDYPKLITQTYQHEIDYNFKELIAGAKSFAKKEHIILNTQDLPVGIGGFYNPSDHSITISCFKENDTYFGTLIHELAHSQLHHKTEALPQLKSQMEVQAETVSALIIQYYTDHVSDKSLNYIKYYGKQMKSEEKLDWMKTTIDTSLKLITHIDQYLSGLVLNKNMVHSKHNELWFEL